MGSSDAGQLQPPPPVTLLCHTPVPFTHNQGHQHLSYPAVCSDVEQMTSLVSDLEPRCKKRIPIPLFLAAAALGGCRHRRNQAVVWGRTRRITSPLSSVPSGEIERQVQSIWHVSIYYEHIQNTHNRSPPPPLAASLHVGKQKMLS